MVVAYMAIGCSMYLLFGLPSAPIRGGLSKWADYLMLALTVLALAVLTFYVVDTAHYAEKLIRHLAFHQTSWPPECLEKKVEQRGMPPEDLEEYTTVRFIAKLTHPIMPLIYYPFIILTLMILARMRVFDNWDWPPALILIYTLNSALAVFSAARLRRAAEEGRRRIVRRLRQKLILIGDISKSERAKRLSATIDEIVAIREGAFISMSQNPVIGALMLPSGAGLLVVIQYLAKGF